MGVGGMKAWEAGASSEDTDRYNKLYLYDGLQVTQKNTALLHQVVSDFQSDIA